MLPKCLPLRSNVDYSTVMAEMKLEMKLLLVSILLLAVPVGGVRVTNNCYQPCEVEANLATFGSP